MGWWMIFTSDSVAITTKQAIAYGNGYLPIIPRKPTFFQSVYYDKINEYHPFLDVNFVLPQPVEA